MKLRDAKGMLRDWVKQWSKSGDVLYVEMAETILSALDKPTSIEKTAIAIARRRRFEDGCEKEAQCSDCCELSRLIADFDKKLEKSKR